MTINFFVTALLDGLLCKTLSALDFFDFYFFSYAAQQRSSLVTLSTACDWEPSFKYLRFARKIDWNNFSHTDSFSSRCLVGLPFSKKFTTRYRGEINFRYFCDEFSWEFFLSSLLIEAANHSLYLLHFFLSSFDRMITTISPSSPDWRIRWSPSNFLPTSVHGFNCSRYNLRRAVRFR